MLGMGLSQPLLWFGSARHDEDGWGNVRWAVLLFGTVMWCELW